MGLIMNAQESLGSHPFDIPAANSYVCRQVEPYAGDSLAAHGFEFEIGRGPFEDVRTIQVSYDKQGGVLQLADINIRRGGQQTSVETVAVRFLPNGTTKSFRVRHVPPKAQEEPVVDSLSAPEIAKARRLGEWLWKRRCDPSRPK